MQQSAWPSVEEQLTQDRVQPSSALERLIHENQDFQMLRPEEANDSLALPPWLRVYWRKAHPESVPSANDPSGGYPRVLKRIYAWMLANPDLPSISQVMRDDG